jgi:hypothetical protein
MRNMSLRGRGRFQQLRFLELALFMGLYLTVSPFLREDGLLKVLTGLFFLNSLLVALSTGGMRAGWKWVLWGLWLVSVGASSLSLLPLGFGADAGTTTVEIGSLFLLVAGCIAAILAYVFRRRQVTLDGIFAALVAYLLIAYTFALIYMLVVLWAPESFKLPPPAAGSRSDPSRSDLIYFSLVTIATLGYGDIVPAADLPRMIGALEAVTGQFYVAVVVALLVGMYISQSLAPAGWKPDVGALERQNLVQDPAASG